MPGSVASRRSYGRSSTRRCPFFVFGFPRAMVATDRSAFRRFGTGWYRLPLRSCSLRSLKPICLNSSMAFGPNVDAKMALRRVYFHLAQYRRTEVVDADLADYFNTIPHGPLMKC